MPARLLSIPWLIAETAEAVIGALKAKFVVATTAIGLDLPAIGAEAAALRKRAR